MTVVAQTAAAGLRPEMVLTFVLLALLLIMAAARALGAVARRLGQPTVVGEIVAGILLGPTLLGPTLAGWSRPWAFLQCETALAVTPKALETSVSACLFPPQARPLLGIIGQLGLALFMLIVGLDFDTDRLRGQGRAAVTLTLGAVAAPLAAGVVVGPVLYAERFVPAFGTAAQPPLLAFQLTVGALLSVTAFPVMAHILREKQLAGGQMGSVAMASAAMVTVCTFLLIAAAAAVAGGGGHGLALRGLLVIAYLAGLWYGLRPLLARVLGPRLRAAGRLGGDDFALLFGTLLASSLLAHRLGVTVIVGAFLTGLVLPARQLLRAELVPRLHDLTLVVLLPVFLAYSGLQTDFTLLDGAAAAGIVLLLVAGVASKWVAGALAGRLGGLSWTEANLAGVLMNCRGLLPLVVALIALEQGLISPTLQLGAVVMALVTTVMTGPLFDAFLTRATVRAVGGARDAVPKGL